MLPSRPKPPTGTSWFPLGWGGSRYYETFPLVIPREATGFTKLCLSQRGLSRALSDTLPCFTCHSLYGIVPDTRHRRAATTRRSKPRPRAATMIRMTPRKAETTGAYPPHFCLRMPSYSHPINTPSTRLASQTLFQPKCSSNLSYRYPPHLHHSTAPPRRDQYHCHESSSTGYP